MKNLLLRACIVVAALLASPAFSQVVRLPVVTGTSGSPTSSGASVLIGSNGAEKGTSGNPVVTSCPTCSGSSGPAATQLPATLGAKTGATSLSVVPNTDTAFPVTGTFWQATQPVSGTIAATQSGTWNLTNISGTVSLPTGAATSALQTTINTTLGSPFQAGGSIGNTSFAATQATASSLNAAVVGNVADAASDSGNSVKVGGVYSSTPPTLSTGQRGKLQLDVNGNLQSRLMATSGSIGDAVPTANTGLIRSQDNTLNLMLSTIQNALNGSTYDRVRTIQGSDGTGIGIYGVAIAPQSNANGAIAGIVSTAAEGSHVLKASAGNLYRVSITTGASAGLLMVFNATSAPADGAVTPAICRVVAANSSLEINAAEMPIRFGTGITAVFSTGTDCFTKAISATAFIAGYVQ